MNESVTMDLETIKRNWPALMYIGDESFSPANGEPWHYMNQKDGMDGYTLKGYCGATGDGRECAFGSGWVMPDDYLDLFTATAIESDSCPTCLDMFRDQTLAVINGATMD